MKNAFKEIAGSGVLQLSKEGFIRVWTLLILVR